MEVVALAAVTALVVKVIDVLRYIQAGDLGNAATQLEVWTAGVAVTQLAVHAGGPFTITALTGLGWWAQLFYGLTIASAGSVVKDTIQAVRYRPGPEHARSKPRIRERLEP